MNQKTYQILLILLSMLTQNGLAQGFINLNFESAQVSPGTPPGTLIPASSAIPGWTAYYIDSSATNVASQIGYNGVSLGAAFTFLIDTNFGFFPPLQGSYSLLLEGSQVMTPTAAAIGQTGQIPLNALSLLFYLSLDSNIQVTFNGQLIPLVQTGSTPNYVIMGGDISAYAGQTGQLLFSAPPANGYGLIDNIQFSSSSVPEPGTLCLAALGGVLLARRCWKKQNI